MRIISQVAEPGGRMDLGPSRLFLVGLAPLLNFAFWLNEFEEHN